MHTVQTVTTISQRLATELIVEVMSTDAAEVPVIFDSLPYYDDDLERDPLLREKAERLIARELSSNEQTQLHARLPPAIALFAVCVPWQLFSSV